MVGVAPWWTSFASVLSVSFLGVDYFIICSRQYYQDDSWYFHKISDFEKTTKLFIYELSFFSVSSF